MLVLALSRQVAGSLLQTAAEWNVAVVLMSNPLPSFFHEAIVGAQSSPDPCPGGASNLSGEIDKVRRRQLQGGGLSSSRARAGSKSIGLGGSLEERVKTHLKGQGSVQGGNQAVSETAGVPNLSYVHVCGGGSQSERQGDQLSSFAGDQGRFW